jgi:hypothetical protein
MTNNSVHADPETFTLTAKLAQKAFENIFPNPKAFPLPEAQAEIRDAAIQVLGMFDPDRERAKREANAFESKYERN